MDAAAPHDRIDRVDKMLEDLKTKAPEKIKGVILDHFHWHRIVLDEGHEVMKDEFTTGKISYLVFNFQLLPLTSNRCYLLFATNVCVVYEWHSFPKRVRTNFK